MCLTMRLDGEWLSIQAATSVINRTGTSNAIPGSSGALLRLDIECKRESF